MASFGSYETDREVYSGTSYTVYSARKTGHPHVEYAIKVFTVRQLGLEPESAAELDPLLQDLENACVARIGVQQQAATASRFVSPVFETGRDERGVWYATRLYPRSVNKIITGRVALSRDALEHIVRSMALGALDLKRTCGRSHGEILPSNVQISRSEKMVEAEVVLSDPLPGDQKEAARYELSDLRSIGLILLQLVLRREIRQDENAALLLPNVPSSEWTRLFGKDASHWLELCHRLLDPNLSLDRLTLEQLAARLDQLQPKKGVSPKLLRTAAAALLVLGVLLFFLLRPRSQSVRVTSDPPGATVLVGQKMQKGKTPVTLKLKKGNYAIEARHETMRLREQTTNWVVSGGGSAKLHFLFAYGLVKITSNPSNAAVELDGNDVGHTPYTSSFLAAGPQTYVLRLTDYQPAKVSVTVPTNREVASVETNLIPMRGDDGVVEISSSPPGATILEGADILGEAPLPKTLSKGPHQITAKFEDWPLMTKNIVVESGENPPVNFVFPYGIALFDISPPDAEISLDGKRLGRDIRRKALQPRNYKLSVTNAGYYPEERIFTVRKDMTTNISFLMKAMNGIVEFWTDPPGAAIVDANLPTKVIGRTQPGEPLKQIFNPGTYSFTAQMDGLEDVKTNLSVALGDNKKHTFVFDYGTVQLKSVPSEATVFVDGQKRGPTPATIFVKPGFKHSYRVEASDYLPATNELVVGRRESKEVVVPLQREPVMVTLKSDPPGAQFFSNEILLAGRNAIYAMPWGTNAVTAKHQRLDEVTKSVVARKGVQNDAEFKFEYGTVMLTNLPAEVVIKEGNDVLAEAPGPIRLAYEMPGRHNYAFYVDGEKITNRLAEVIAGRITTLPAGLVEEVGRFKNSIGMQLTKVRDLFGQGRDGWVGKYEVTQKEYQAVMGNNPSDKWIGDDYPVQNVVWSKANEFCQRLTQKDREARLYRGGYALPTLAQWRFFAEGTDRANEVVRTNQPARVGSKSPNKFKLCDVLGNVREWTQDGKDPNRFHVGFAYGSYQLIGDGNADKDLSTPDPNIGFRVILVPGP